MGMMNIGDYDLCKCALRRWYNKSIKAQEEENLRLLEAQKKHKDLFAEVKKIVTSKPQAPLSSVEKDKIAKLTDILYSEVMIYAEFHRYGTMFDAIMRGKYLP